MGRVWFRVRSACPPAVSGSDVRCGRACLAWVSAVPRPSSLGCRGVFFGLYFLSALRCRLPGVPVPGLVVPVPPSLFFRARLLALLFFRGVCLHVSVSLFPPGRCSWLGVAGFGWVVPLCLFGGPVFGAFWGWVWPPLVVLAGGLLAVCCFRAPPPSPLCCFFLGGGGGLPVPHSAFPGLAHALARIQCCLPGCCWRLRSVWPCSGPMGRAGYVHVGLGAPSCRVRSWLCRLGGCARGPGLFVSFPLCGAGFNLLGGPPLLLPGARWPLVWPAVPVCGVLVRRLPGCAVACFG